MKTTFFWIAWLGISFWLLKTFYGNYQRERMRALRVAAAGMDALVLLLFFFPWLPVPLGGATGLALLWERNLDIVAISALLLLGAIFFFSGKGTLLKLGAVFHIAASVIFIGAMLRLMPGTYTLDRSGVAPIVAILLLLAGNVAVLLLWHQQERKEGKRVSLWGGRRLAVVLPLLLVGVGGYWYFSSAAGRETRSIALVQARPEVQEFRKAVLEGGRSSFAVRIVNRDEPGYLIQVYEIFPDHTATFGWYRYDVRTGRIAEEDFLSP